MELLGVRLEIPANGNADVALPASFKFSDLGQAAATVLQKGSAGYKAEGTLGVKTPIGVTRVLLEPGDSWVVTRPGPGGMEPGQTVLRPVQA